MGMDDTAVQHSCDNIWRGRKAKLGWFSATIPLVVSNPISRPQRFSPVEPYALRTCSTPH
jgi:hypothetical protein